MSMHIERANHLIHGNQELGRTQRTASARPTETHRATGMRDMTDQAQTTILARLTAREIAHMHQQDTVRPDKIEQFKHLADPDSGLDDRVIDTIMHRMFG